jgi:predicted transcriptional regulator
MPALGALAWAVELHARAAVRLARSTPVGYLAHEIADELPHALAAGDP